MLSFGKKAIIEIVIFFSILSVMFSVILIIQPNILSVFAAPNEIDEYYNQEKANEEHYNQGEEEPEEQQGKQSVIEELYNTPMKKADSGESDLVLVKLLGLNKEMEFYGTALNKNNKDTYGTVVTKNSKSDEEQYGTYYIMISGGTPASTPNRHRTIGVEISRLKTEPVQINYVDEYGEAQSMYKDRTVNPFEEPYSRFKIYEGGNNHSSSPKIQEDYDPHYYTRLKKSVEGGGYTDDTTTCDYKTYMGWQRQSFWVYVDNGPGRTRTYAENNLNDKGFYSGAYIKDYPTSKAMTYTVIMFDGRLFEKKSSRLARTSMQWFKQKEEEDIYADGGETFTVGFDSIKTRVITSSTSDQKAGEITSTETKQYAGHIFTWANWKIPSTYYFSGSGGYIGNDIDWRPYIYDYYVKYGAINPNPPDDTDIVITSEESVSKEAEVEEEAHFTLTKNAGKTKIGNSKANDKYASPELYTWNNDDSEQFDLGTAIPTTEDYVNYIKADSWYGSIDITQNEYRRTHKIPYYVVVHWTYCWDSYDYWGNIKHHRVATYTPKSGDNNSTWDGKFYAITGLNLYELTSFKTSNDMNIVHKYNTDGENTAHVSYEVTVNGETVRSGSVRAGATMETGDTEDEILVKSTTRYKVTFRDWDGTELVTRIVEEGKNAKAPISPNNREGYRFYGWNRSFKNVQGNIDVIAKYTKADGTADTSLTDAEFTVTFKDWDGTLIKSSVTKYGETAEEPVFGTDFSRSGYTFTGWSDLITNTTEDHIVYAQYMYASDTGHMVVFKDWNGVVLKCERVADGGSATAPIITDTHLLEADREGYTFTGWNREYTNVTEDIYCIAQYSANDPALNLTHTITFFDYDGTQIGDPQIINHGEAATYPDGYGPLFTEWEADVDIINSDMYIFIRHPNTIPGNLNGPTTAYDEWHKVEFLKKDGSVLGIQYVVNKGTLQTPYIVPDEDGYRFENWETLPSEVVSDLRIMPVYVRNEAPAAISGEYPTVTVTFRDYDGRIISKTTYEDTNFDTFVSYTIPAENPTREGYEFEGWDTEFATYAGIPDYVTSADIEAYAIYKPEPTPVDDVDKDLTPDLDYHVKFNESKFNGTIIKKSATIGGVYHTTNPAAVTRKLKELVAQAQTETHKRVRDNDDLYSLRNDELSINGVVYLTNEGKDLDPKYTSSKNYNLPSGSVYKNQEYFLVFDRVGPKHFSYVAEGTKEMTETSWKSAYSAYSSYDLDDTIAPSIDFADEKAGDTAISTGNTYIDPEYTKITGCELKDADKHKHSSDTVGGKASLYATQYDYIKDSEGSIIPMETKNGKYYTNLVATYERFIFRKGATSGGGDGKDKINLKLNDGIKDGSTLYSSLDGTASQAGTEIKDAVLGLNVKAPTNWKTNYPNEDVSSPAMPTITGKDKNQFWSHNEPIIVHSPAIAPVTITGEGKTQLINPDTSVTQWLLDGTYTVSFDWEKYFEEELDYYGYSDVYVQNGYVDDENDYVTYTDTTDRAKQYAAGWIKFLDQKYIRFPFTVQVIRYENEPVLPDGTPEIKTQLENAIYEPVYTIDGLYAYKSETVSDGSTWQLKATDRELKNSSKPAVYTDWIPLGNETEKVVIYIPTWAKEGVYGNRSWSGYENTSKDYDGDGRTDDLPVQIRVVANNFTQALLDLNKDNNVDDKDFDVFLSLSDAKMTELFNAMTGDQDLDGDGMPGTDADKELFAQLPGILRCSQATYNKDKDGYIATYQFPVEVSGQIYGFQIVSVYDKVNWAPEGWEDKTGSGVYNFVRESETSAEAEKKVGKYNRLGGVNVRYTLDGHETDSWEQFNTLPLAPGKSAYADAQLSATEGTKPGYLVKGNTMAFTVKTIANLDGKQSYMYIEPEYRYIDKTGRVWEKDEISLYYDDGDASYIKLGSAEDKITGGHGKYITLGDFPDVSFYDGSYFDYYYDTLSDTRYHDGLTIKELTDLPHLAYTASEIKLSSGLRLITGNEEELAKNILGNLNNPSTSTRYTKNVAPLTIHQVTHGDGWTEGEYEKFRYSMQTWYGKYTIPNTLRVCPSSIDLDDYIHSDGTNGYVDGTEDYWFRDGELMLTFKIKTCRDGDNDHLQYYGYGLNSLDRWKVEKYEPENPPTPDPDPDNPTPPDPTPAVPETIPVKYPDPDDPSDEQDVEVRSGDIGLIYLDYDSVANHFTVGTLYLN